MRHRRAPYLAIVLALAVAAPADARTVTIRQRQAPQLTFTLPAGWQLRAGRDFTLLTRRGRRFVLRQCPLYRSERDMTGRHATPIGSQRDLAAVPVPGGSCMVVTGSRAHAFARRLHPRLGPATLAPPSDAAAEQLARAARKRTLAMARVEGSAFATVGSARIGGTFEWDLPARYSHQLLRFGDVTDEVVRNPSDNYVRSSDRPSCWTFTTEPESDDTLEPRLELREWDAPPATATAWRVSYAPAEPQPDGTTLVRWTGFVADGEAEIGADGRFRRIRIDDHGQARGRTIWDSVEVTFTDFPAAITQVRPEPACP